MSLEKKNKNALENFLSFFKKRILKIKNKKNTQSNRWRHKRGWHQAMTTKFPHYSMFLLKMMLSNNDWLLLFQRGMFVILRKKNINIFLKSKPKPRKVQNFIVKIYFNGNTSPKYVCGSPKMPNRAPNCMNNNNPSAK